MADNPLLKAIQGEASTDSPLLQALTGNKQTTSAYDPAKQVAGIEARFDAAGVNPDAELDRRSIFEKSFNLPDDQNFFFDFMEVLNRPQQAIYSAITAGVEGKNVLEGVWKGLSGQEEQVGGDVLEKLGLGDSFITKTAGFAMDIFLDPMDLALWSVGAGAASVAANAAQAGQVAGKVYDVARVIDDVNDVSRVMKSVGTWGKVGNVTFEGGKAVAKAGAGTIDDVLKATVNIADELATNPKGAIGFANWLNKSKGATKLITSREFVFRGVKTTGKYTFSKADQMSRFVLGKLDELRFAKVADPDAIKAMTSYAQTYGNAIDSVKSMFSAVGELGRSATKSMLGRVKKAGEKMRLVKIMGADAGGRLFDDIDKTAQDFIKRGKYTDYTEAYNAASRAVANAYEITRYIPDEMLKRFIMPQAKQIKIVTGANAQKLTRNLEDKFSSIIGRDDIANLFVKNADETFTLDENVLRNIMGKLDNTAAGSRILRDLTDVIVPRGNKFASYDDLVRAKDYLRSQFQATPEELDKIFYTQGNALKVNPKALEDFMNQKDLLNIPKSVQDILDPKVRLKETRKWRKTLLNEIDKISNKDKSGFADMIMREGADFDGIKFVDEKTRKKIIAFYRQFGFEIDETGVVGKSLGQIIEDTPQPTNVGYHAGDLGKAENYYSQMGGRGTGHYGTGTYFVGNEELIKSGTYAGRPHKRVNFENYKLYRPKSVEGGERVHEALKIINSADDRILRASQDTRYYLDMQGELSPDQLEKFNRNVEKMKRSLFDLQLELGVEEDELLRLVKESYEETSKYDPDLRGKAIIEGRDTPDDVTIRNKVRSTDSRSTVLMKKLGYEGVDVRGLKYLDSVTYGSVIYDLKPEDVIDDTGKIIKTAEQQALPLVTGEKQQIFGEPAFASLFEKRILNNGAVAYVLDEKALEGLWDELQKRRELMTLEQRLDFDAALDGVIEAPRFYTKAEVDELRSLGLFEDKNLFGEESPLMNAMKTYDELRLRFAEMVDSEFDTMFGMFDDGYVRHVMTPQAQDALKKNYLFRNSFAGRLQDFNDRKFRMSAKEANLIAQEQLKIWKERGYSAMEAFDDIDDFKLFEEDIMKSFLDFVKDGAELGSRMRKFDTLVNSNLLDDPTAFRRVDLRGNPIMAGTQMRGFSTVTREALIAKAKGFYSQMKGGDELFAKLEKQLNAMPDVVAINHAIMDQIGMNYEQGASMIGKAVDAVNGVFKSLKLANLGFQVRNIVGNLTNAYLSGMNILEFSNFTNIKKARRILTMGNDVMSQVARFGIKSIQADPDKMEIYRLFKRFKEAGFDQMGTQFLEKSGNIEEIAKTLGLKIDKGQTKAWHLLKISEQMNTSVDSTYRMLGLIYGEAHPEFLQRYDLMDSEELVRKVFFDPRDLTNFERSTMKRLVPFYTFTKKNLAYQFTNVFDNPKKYSDVMKFMNYTYDLIDLDKDIVEDYKVDNFWLPVYKDADGNVKMLKLNLPISALSEFTEGPLEQALSALTPIVRSPFEVVANKQLYTGQTIKEFEGQEGYKFPWLDRTAEYAVSQTGLDTPISAIQSAMENISSLAQGKGLAGPLAPSIVSQTNEQTMLNTQAYNRLEELRGYLKYYKQEGKPIPTMREMEQGYTGNLANILKNLQALK